jgi:hypothetical protein
MRANLDSIDFGAVAVYEALRHDVWRMSTRLVDVMPAPGLHSPRSNQRLRHRQCRPVLTRCSIASRPDVDVLRPLAAFAEVARSADARLHPPQPAQLTTPGKRATLADADLLLGRGLNPKNGLRFQPALKGATARDERLGSAKARCYEGVEASSLLRLERYCCAYSEITQKPQLGADTHGFVIAGIAQRGEVQRRHSHATELGDRGPFEAEQVGSFGDG